MTYYAIADTRNPKAIAALERFKLQSPNNLVTDLNQHPRSIQAADPSRSTILAFGGDGLLLHAAHLYSQYKIPFYGINYGTVGFLLNDPQSSQTELLANMSDTIPFRIHFLKINITTISGQQHQYHAMNEVSLLRESSQVSHIKILVNSIERMARLVADGVVLSTPAGSTAYNFSLHGPVIAPSMHLFSICPVSPFRPRHWRGALISDSSVVKFIVENPEKRPTSATVDFANFTNVSEVEASKDHNNYIDLLFDRSFDLEEKVKQEQFMNLQ